MCVCVCVGEVGEVVCILVRVCMYVFFVFITRIPCSISRGRCPCHQGYVQLCRHREEGSRLVCCLCVCVIESERVCDIVSDSESESVIEMGRRERNNANRRI